MRQAHKPEGLSLLEPVAAPRGPDSAAAEPSGPSPDRTSSWNMFCIVAWLLDSCHTADVAICSQNSARSTVGSGVRQRTLHPTPERSFGSQFLTASAAWQTVRARLPVPRRLRAPRQRAGRAKKTARARMPVTKQSSSQLQRPRICCHTHTASRRNIPRSLGNMSGMSGP